jgi:hypothetical protein
MFYACSGDIPRNPLLYPKVHNEFRRCLLRRFPYAVYFTINNEQIIVAGLFHGARDPRTIASMLQNRLIWNADESFHADRFAACELVVPP